MINWKVAGGFLIINKKFGSWAIHGALASVKGSGHMSQKIGLYHLKTVDGSHLTMSNIKMGLNLAKSSPFIWSPFPIWTFY